MGNRYVLNYNSKPIYNFNNIAELENFLIKNNIIYRYICKGFSAYLIFSDPRYYITENGSRISLRKRVR